MTRRGLAGLLVAALAGLGAAAAGSRLERVTSQRPAYDSLLYLPNGPYLRVASLGHASLVADAVYIWAIQFYSNYERQDRYHYVEHVFSNVIAELDPHYVDPYWLGSMILIAEAHDLEAGLRLLDKGFANNPDQWVLPYLAGWECYHVRQLDRAARYFQQAAAVPGAQPAVARMAAHMQARTGSLREALRFWEAALADPECDQRTRAIARQQMRDLKPRVDVEELRAAVERFRIDNARPPRALAELRERGYLGVVPVDADGREYPYDARAGTVSFAATRVLGARR
ncbi:MAG TPA: hypothetical protein VJS92_16335 [Candidatus Polarisedimenticolaceae bacterium]|nr:hypothetical protein [Candidatus Polarisedimenticolaceae bacterium]